MAVVYHAHDLKHGREVAIKVLQPELALVLGTDRFHREIELEARLQHPNILALYDSGEVGKCLYCVMPYVEGGSLRDRLDHEKHLSLEESFRILRQVGDALTHAHGKGIVHRDVKPENILIEDGHARLADFGIARVVSDVGAEKLTQSGIVIGTPAYMSPEQASADPVDSRSDQYGLACVLFEMLAGEPPFTGATPRAVLARQMQEPPRSLEVVRPDVPKGVSQAILKALAKVPAGRFSTVDDFLAAVESPAPVILRENTSRSRGLILAAVIILAAVGSVVGWRLSLADGVLLSENKIAVFPLVARGVGEDGTGAGRSVAYLIEAALEHAEPLRLIDATSRLREDQVSSPDLISSAAANEIARAQGAAYYLRGVVQGHRDSTTVILQLFDVQGDSLVAQRSAAGEVTETPLHHLGLDALKALLPRLIDPSREVDLTPLRDRRADAIALWMQGERHYRQSRFSSALDLYERALGADSALAIAAVKGAQAAGWLHEIDRGETMIEIALSVDSLLPERYTVLARGLRGFFAGEADSAVSWLQTALQLSPEWPDAATALGEVYNHLLPSAGPLDSLAVSMYESALASDSGFAPPLFHMAEATIRKGNFDDAELLLGRFETVNPDPNLVHHLRLMLNCVERPSEMDWTSQAGANSGAVLSAGKNLAGAGYQFECAEAAMRAVLAESEASRAEHWGAFLGLQGILVATGRDREAVALIDSVAVQSGTTRSLFVLGALAGAQMQDQAAELDAFARDRFGEYYHKLQRAEPIWILANWHRSLGNHARVDSLQKIISVAAATTGQKRDQILAAGVAAQAALAHDTARAISLLLNLPSSAGVELEWGFSGGLPAERILLPMLLLEQGRYAESLLAASVFDHPLPITFLQYLPVSLAIRLKAAKAVGNTRAAGVYRQRLQELYREDLIVSSQ